jgi:dTDP-4-dehydrorhamnose reductase|tara:strand:- start:1117 stop:1989 length:873 start_codon:yes stop_codon:yes gene_type:complete
MILIIGGSGFLGYYLHQSLRKLEEKVISTYNKSMIDEENFYELDIRKVVDVSKFLIKYKPRILIYAVGITDVDLCERNKKLANAINVEGIKNIIEHITDTDTKIIYFSTSFVFDGTKKFYLETDKPNPISYYGESKLQGEKIVQDSGLPYAIIRTDQPYGWKKNWHHTNSMLRIIEKLEKNITYNEIIDWYNTPTSIEDIVKMTRKLLEDNYEGIFHIVSDDFLSRVEFAEVVVEVFGLNKNNIKKIHSNELKLSAKRPNVRLKNSKKVDLKMDISNVFEGLKKMKEMRT